MSKNKQVSNKPVPHKSDKPAKKVEADNAALHETFYAVHTPALYQKEGFLFRGSVAKSNSSTENNGSLAKQWSCTERHVSKVRGGRGEPKCQVGCSCPNAMKSKQPPPVAAASAA